MKRLIDKYLLAWKESKYRMSLLIRGARQVGKTYAVTQLGKSFEDFVEINFERRPDFTIAFEKNLEPHRIIQDLGLMLGKPIIPGKTLLFFDEIQESEKAFKSLRYFYERLPELHVIAAGSLLDFQIEKIGIAVGRIEWFYMYPLSFIEFLYALNQNMLAEAILDHRPGQPISDVVHHMALSFLGEYLAIGGMPASVKCWRDSRDMFTCGNILQAIVNTYRKDFDKYAKRSQIKYLDALFKYIPGRLGRKFKYSEVSKDYKKRELEPALTALSMAGIVTQIFRSTGQGIPLGAHINIEDFKVIFLDGALSQVVLGADLGAWIVDPLNQFINKGEFVEAFVGQELLAYTHPFRERHLYYWRREERTSSAEVDYLIQKDEHVVPIEVKSGTGKVLQSMKLFLETHPPIPYGIKLSPSNYATLPPSAGKSIEAYPLYAIAKIAENRHYSVSL
jgi:uncharacterized protein